MKLAFGGMAPTTVTAPKTSESLKSQMWSQSMLERAIGYLSEDLPLAPGAPGGMIDYRKALTMSFFFRAFLAIAKEIGKSK